MKAIINLSIEVFTALAQAAIEVVSVRNVGGMPDEYKPNMGGPKQ